MPDAEALDTLTLSESEGRTTMTILVQHASIGTDVDPVLAAAAREASVGSFRMAMLVSAGLLAAGAAISAVGLRAGATERA